MLKGVPEAAGSARGAVVWGSVVRVLVTGGAGYIGSVLAEQLMRRGHDVVVYDNLYRGHRDAVPLGVRFIGADLRNRVRLERALREERIDAVMHLAADTSAHESVGEPAKYYMNNMLSGLVMLDMMVACGVRRIVFASSSAVYGHVYRSPIQEDDPTTPSSPYGETKVNFERALHWYAEANGLAAVSLRLFDVAGASETSGERHDPETHLVPLLLEAAAGKRDEVRLASIGLRDYMHVVDAAHAHVLALESLTRPRPGHVAYNIGSGNGLRIGEVVEAVRAVTGEYVPVRIESTSYDGLGWVPDISRAKAELGWTPQYSDIRTIIDSAWRFYCHRERQAASVRATPTARIDAA